MENVTTSRGFFITGLRNAHAMENQALALIESQLNRLENYPEVSELLDQHKRETEAQLQRIDEILLAQDENSSGLKDVVMSMTGTMAALTHSVAPDEVVKNSMANFAFEHFEIAAYTSLITSARMCGASAAIPQLEQSLLEEQRMADMIKEMLPTVTERYITLRASGKEAGV